MTRRAYLSNLPTTCISFSFGQSSNGWERRPWTRGVATAPADPAMRGGGHVRVGARIYNGNDNGRPSEIRIRETFLGLHQCKSQMAADMTDQIIEIVESKGLSFDQSEGRAMAMMAQAQWVVHTAEFRSLFRISNLSQFMTRSHWRGVCRTYVMLRHFYHPCRNCMRSSVTAYADEIYCQL